MIKMSYLIIYLSVVGISMLVISSCSQKAIKEEMPVNLDSNTEIANHQPQINSKIISSREPKVGMAMSEVDISFQLIKEKVTLNNGIIYGLYANNNNTKYHIYFTVKPAKVSFWSAFDFEDIEIKELHELQNRDMINLSR